MKQKSCTTKDDDYPIIKKVLTIPGGAGFLPSTVAPEHRQVTMLQTWISSKINREFPSESMVDWVRMDKNRLLATVSAQSNLQTPGLIQQ